MEGKKVPKATRKKLIFMVKVSCLYVVADEECLATEDDPKICTCDLTESECDVNCCCDPSCSNDDRQAFSMCIDQRMSVSQPTLSLCCCYLIHDLLFLPISTIESAMGKHLITHCCVSRLACSRSSGHIEPHSPDFKREINTTTTVMN